MTDEALLERCAAGDEAALAELMRRWGTRLFRLAVRVLGGAARAEEAATEAWTQVWFGSRGWRGESSAGTWILRVAYRTILDHARLRRRWWRSVPPAAARPADPHDDPAVFVAERERQERTGQRLERALAGLSPADRAAVHLHYFEDRPLAEIAGIVGITREALKMRLHRARAELKAALGEDDELLRTDS